MTKNIIDKKTLEHLVGLSRIELKPGKEEKLLKDMENILTYFDELKEVNTDNIEPMAGGGIQKNIFRDDETSDKRQATSDKLIEQFPEKENGFLKVPGVFADEV